MSLDGGGRIMRHLGMAGTLAVLAACSGSAPEVVSGTPPSSTGAPAGIVDSRFGQDGTMVFGTASDDAFQAILGTTSGELIAIAGGAPSSSRASGATAAPTRASAPVVAS